MVHWTIQNDIKLFYWNIYVTPKQIIEDKTMSYSQNDILDFFVTYILCKSTTLINQLTNKDTNSGGVKFLAEICPFGWNYDFVEYSYPT